MAKNRPKENVSRTTQIKLNEIANKLGTTVEKLMESYNDPKEVIKKYESGELKLLTE
jgi:hypothetical protein